MGSVVRRSMGILLPPVPQATATTLTHHHRNRSLDSALQRIPEVDVTPSPECENPAPVVKTTTSSSEPGKGRNREREDLASLGSDDSGILCGSDSGSSDATNATTTRESSVDHLHSRESLDSSVSQPGDMYSVDVVDGAENSGDVVSVSVSSSVSVSVSVSVPVSPVELSTRLADESPGPSKDAVTAGDGDQSRRDSVTNSERCSQESRPSTARDSSREHCDYQQQEQRVAEIAIYHRPGATVQTPSPSTVASFDAQNELAGAAMTLCCGAATQQEAETVKKQQPDVVRRQQEMKQPKPSEGCLLRLFESQIFDMSMAISYLFNSKEPGVQSYLGIIFLPPLKNEKIKKDLEESTFDAAMKIVYYLYHNIYIYIIFTIFKSYRYDKEYCEIIVHSA